MAIFLKVLFNHLWSITLYILISRISICSSKVFCCILQICGLCKEESKYFVVLFRSVSIDLKILWMDKTVIRNEASSYIKYDNSDFWRLHVRAVKQRRCLYRSRAKNSETYSLFSVWIIHRSVKSTDQFSCGRLIAGWLILMIEKFPRWR